MGDKYEAALHANGDVQADGQAIWRDCQWVEYSGNGVHYCSRPAEPLEDLCDHHLYHGEVS